jgi:hypothetical protein
MEARCASEGIRAAGSFLNQLLQTAEPLPCEQTAPQARAAQCVQSVSVGEQPRKSA